MTDKAALRRIARQRRRAFVAAQPDRHFAPKHVSGLSGRIAPGDIVASYRAIGSEADPALLERLVTDAHGQLCWPRIASDGAMHFASLGPSGAWEDAPFGGWQPGADSCPVAPALILMPLLAFTREGIRLGQGGGHYDRTLVRHPEAFRVGIAWSVQEMDWLPRDPWDIALNAIMTEQEWIAT